MRPPHCWTDQRVIVVHMGGEATGILTDVKDVQGPDNPIPHVLIVGADGRPAMLPFSGITYIAPAKPVEEPPSGVNLMKQRRRR